MSGEWQVPVHQRIEGKDWSYLRFAEFSEFIQAERFGQLLLREGLFGSHNGGARRPFFTLRWIKKHELLDLS